MAIFTKPRVKIRAWLSPCVSLLTRLIAPLYGLLIAWAHVAPCELLKLCEYDSCTFTHWISQCVIMWVLCMYICLGLYAVSVLLYVPCLMANCKPHRSKSQQITNLFTNDLLTPVSCFVIGSSYSISTSSSDASTAFAHHPDEQRQPPADAAPPAWPAAKCHWPTQTTHPATQDTGM